MSVYAYPQSKIIDEVTFKKSEGGAVRAYIHAKDGVGADTLAQITDGLKRKGWQCTPYTFAGRPMLEVRNFDKESKLLKVLSNQGWVQAAPFVRRDKEDRLGFKEKLKKRSLFASSAAFMVADSSFFIYGLKEASKLDMAGGLAYFAGSLGSIISGRKDPSDLQIKDLSCKLADYLKMHGATMPETCSLNAVIQDHDKGLIKKADDLFRRYPAEIMNLSYALAGTCIAAASYKHRVKGFPKPGAVQERLDFELEKVKSKFPHAEIPHQDIEAHRKIAEKKVLRDHYREGWMDVGLGATTFTSGLLASFIKEKAHDPDKPKAHGLKAVYEWVQERPLAIAGYGYMVSTFCHAVSTTIAWNGADKERKKSVPFRMGFIAFTLLGELLLTISSKGHGDGVKSDASIDNTIIASAAELISKQPSKTHDVLIEAVGNFLGRPDVLAINDGQAKQQIRTLLEELKKNPWAVANNKETTPQAEIEAKPAAAAKAEQVPAWAAKVAMKDTAATPQLSA